MAPPEEELFYYPPFEIIYYIYINSAILCPITGTAVTKLVITVAKILI